MLLEKPQYWMCAARGTDGKRFAIRFTWERYTSVLDAVKEAYGTTGTAYMGKPIGTRKGMSQKRLYEMCQSDEGWIGIKRNKR